MDTREDFVKKYASQVAQLTSSTGILPGTLFAQAILESSGKINGKWLVGASRLARDYNNYFGIKASNAWKGKVVDMKTREVFDGIEKTITDGFRVYDSFVDSAKDYVKFLQENPRYRKNGVFEATTVKDQAAALKRAGYATDPEYASKVTSVFNSIKDNMLTAIKENPFKSGFSILLIGLITYLLINK